MTCYLANNLYRMSVAELLAQKSRIGEGGRMKCFIPHKYFCYKFDFW